MSSSQFSILPNCLHNLFEMGSIRREVEVEFPGLIRVYKDGCVERMFPDPTVPPSPEDPETGVSSKDIKVFSQDSRAWISARLYLPKLTDQTTQQKLPVLVYFHGGAFCLRSPASLVYHRYMNILASLAQVVIVSVKYRIAPEHPLPAAYEDCWAGLKWVASLPEAEPWLVNHGDLSALFVGGDSAGGNIVHNILMQAGSESLDNQGEVKILGAFLSHHYVLDERTEQLEVAYKMWEFVYPDAPGGTDSPMINPLAPGSPSLKGLGCSRVLVLVAGDDELRDCGVRYYDAVKTSGFEGTVELFEQEGEGHVYHIVNPDTPNSRIVFNKLASFLQK